MLKCILFGSDSLRTVLVHVELSWIIICGLFHIIGLQGGEVSIHLQRILCDIKRAKSFY